MADEKKTFEKLNTKQNEIFKLSEDKSFANTGEKNQKIEFRLEIFFLKKSRKIHHDSRKIKKLRLKKMKKKVLKLLTVSERTNEGTGLLKKVKPSASKKPLFYDKHKKINNDQVKILSPVHSIR